MNALYFTKTGIIMIQPCVCVCVCVYTHKHVHILYDVYFINFYIYVLFDVIVFFLLFLFVQIIIWKKKLSWRYFVSQRKMETLITNELGMDSSITLMILLTLWQENFWMQMRTRKSLS